jgi:hypothetical protein
MSTISTASAISTISTGLLPLSYCQITMTSMVSTENLQKIYSVYRDFQSLLMRLAGEIQSCRKCYFYPYNEENHPVGRIWYGVNGRQNL